MGGGAHHVLPRDDGWSYYLPYSVQKPLYQFEPGDVHEWTIQTGKTVRSTEYAGVNGPVRVHTAGSGLYFFFTSIGLGPNMDTYDRVACIVPFAVEGLV